MGSDPIGLVCAAREARGVRLRTPAGAASAAAMLLLWPLWAPFARPALPDTETLPRAEPRRRRGRARSRGVWRFGALLAGIGLGTTAFAGLVLVLVFHLWWSALSFVGMLSLALGLVAWARGSNRARLDLIVGFSLLLGPALLRAVLARGTDAVHATTLPGNRGPRLVNTLVPERDGCLFAAGLLGAMGGLNDEEGSEFHAILERAYDRIDVSSLRLPTPAIATYLGLESPSAFDALVIAPSGAAAAPPRAAVVFLHGYAGNFAVYCWELAQAAAAANLLTVCPSLDASGAWWTSRGDETLRATLEHLRGQGASRVYLAGLSNGAAGASVLALRHERELSGLVLISGMRAERPPALPLLVVQGSRDRMMPASYARAYSSRSSRARYHEVEGGHLVFLSRHELVRPAIRAFFEEREAEHAGRSAL